MQPVCQQSRTLIAFETKANALHSISEVVDIIQVRNTIDNVNILSYHLIEMRFEWDEIKNAENQQKHGVCFEDAIEIFSSPYDIEYDSDHSSPTEDRFLATGWSSKHGSLIVVFTEIVDDLIRIISARKGEL